MKQVTFSLALVAVLMLASCGRSTNSNGTPSPGESKTQVVKETASADESSKNQGTPNTTAEILAKPEVPVLCYHRISDGAKGDYTISPAGFRAQMQVLADSGFHSISPDQLYDWLVYDKPLPSKPVMITFDDSRIEHCAIAAPVLEQHGFRGVFFIMTITYGKKNYMTTDQIATLAKAGHTVGLHTWDHTMVTKFKDSTDWRKEIADPQKKLAGFTGKPVDYFAYPNGVFNHAAAEQMAAYCKLSFSLISKRDTICPLQNIRRMITTDVKPASLLKIMRRTFKLNY